MFAKITKMLKLAVGFLSAIGEAIRKRIVNLLYAAYDLSRMGVMMMLAVYMLFGLGAVYKIVATTPLMISSEQALPNLPQLEPSTKIDAAQGIVRLYDQKGQFECTGFVVGNNYILTAGHCLIDDRSILRKEAITVVSRDGSVRTLGVPAGVNTRMDWGLLMGDFHDIPGVPLVSRELIIEHSMLGCGYPQGATTLHCEELSPQVNDTFMIKCAGILFPGMSGGPVFDSKGRVVGINTATYDVSNKGGAQFTTTLAILANFGIAAD